MVKWFFFLYHGLRMYYFSNIYVPNIVFMHVLRCNCKHVTMVRLFPLYCNVGVQCKHTGVAILFFRSGCL